jgi:putative two-component system response regulator
MSQRPRILIIDDSPGSIQSLAGILEAHYDLYFATEGDRGIQLAEQQGIDLVLLDIVMPGMDGYAVCESLKANPRTRHIPVLLVSAIGETDAEERGFALGAADYLGKPFSPAVTRARVATHLELGELRRRVENGN